MVTWEKVRLITLYNLGGAGRARGRVGFAVLLLQLRRPRHVVVLQARRLEDVAAVDEGERPHKHRGPQREGRDGVDRAPYAEELRVEGAVELDRQVRVHALSRRNSVEPDNDNGCRYMCTVFVTMIFSPGFEIERA